MLASILIVPLLGTLLAVVPPDPSDLGTQAHSTDTEFLVERLRNVLDDVGTTTTAASTSDGTPVEVIRAPACISGQYRFDLGPGCINNDPMTVQCIDGSNALDPVWIRTQNPDGTWTSWTALYWYYCPRDAPLVSAIEREWSQLQPEPSLIALQPDTGWVYATVPTIAMASDGVRLHNATLLGADVDIRAIPDHYRWSWGDGDTTTTSDSGRPYPHATLTHTYAHAVASATVALTTTWAGQYRVNGGAWQDFATTIASDSTPAPLVIYDPRSALVACDTNNECRADASG